MSCCRRQLVAALLCSAVIAAAPARAGTRDDDPSTPGHAEMPNDAPATDDIVINGKRVPLDSRTPAHGSLTATQPISIVSKGFVEDAVAPTGDYSQTVKFTPSFSFSSPNGPGGAESRSQVLRGFADGQYNVTFDGVPFGDSNDFTHHSTSFFPAGVLGQVAVDRGPGDAGTIGYATFGGTIALSSRPLSDVADGFARGGYGSFNDRLGMVELQSGRIAATGGTRMLVEYLYHQTDGALEYAGLRTQQFVGKMSQPLGGDWSINLFGSINHTRFNHYNPITPNQLAAYGRDFAVLNNDPRTAIYNKYTYNTKIADFEYVQIVGKVLGIDIDDKAYTFYYRNREYDAPNATDLGLPPTVANANYGSLSGGTGNLDILTNSLGNSYRSFGDTLNLGHRVNAGILSGTLRVGLWWEHQIQDRDSYIADVTRGFVADAASGVDPLSFRGKNANGVTGRGAYLLRVHATIDTLQPYVEYVWTPAPDVTITPGLKHIDFRRHYDAPVNAGSLLPIDVRSGYASTLLSIAANWKVTPANAVYAQVAQGFLAPNVTAYSTASVSKNNFKPQQTVNYQIGFVHSASIFNFDVDGYYIDFNNFITTATDFSVSPNQPYSINGGGVIYKGIEAEASIRLAKALSVFVAGSINSAKTKGSDHRLGGGLWVAGAPENTLSGGLLYDNGDAFGSLLGKRVGARYFGANRTNLNTVGGQAVPTAAAEIVDPTTGMSYVSNRLGSYATLDATLGYRFALGDTGRRSVRFEFQVQNLLDNRQATDTNGRLGRGDTIDPAATTFLYLPPRSVFGTVTVGF